MFGLPLSIRRARRSRRACPACRALYFPARDAAASARDFVSAAPPAARPRSQGSDAAPDALAAAAAAHRNRAAIILAMAGPIWNALPLGRRRRRGRCLCCSTMGGRRRRAGSAGSRSRASALPRRPAPAALPRSCRFRRALSTIAPADPAHNTEKLRALAPVPYAPDRGEILGAGPALSRAKSPGGDRLDR